jgi:hypothetical protein
MLIIIYIINNIYVIIQTISLLFNIIFFIMKLLKVSFVSFFVFCSLLLGSTLYAATDTTTDIGKPILLADVNAYNAKIVSQKGNEINISFDISNGIGVQSGVKYGVSLIKETDGTQSLVDEFIYPEVLSLSSNSTVTKNVKYIAPLSASGEYTLLINIKNESGMPMGMAVAGKATLVSTVKNIEILSETCSLGVVNEKNSPKYDLIQGIDIEKTENLKLTCTVLNSAKEVVSASPVYETHYRTVYGEIVSQEGGDTDSISFKAGEKKIVSLILPKATKPQAYDVKVLLKSKDVSSNSVVVHYVLRGASATIQNFSLDKDYYKKDEVANISFILTPSADNFSESRFAASALSEVTLTATINDDKQKECIAPINKNITNDLNNGKIDLVVPVIANCNNPQATIILKDASGNILDQKSLSFESKKDNVTQTSSNNAVKIILIIFGILVVAGLAFYFINLKKKENETINQ